MEIMEDMKHTKHTEEDEDLFLDDDCFDDCLQFIEIQSLPIFASILEYDEDINEDEQVGAINAAIQIAREYFPNKSTRHLERILWEFTGYPTFWNQKDGSTPEECLRTQLKRHADLSRRGLSSCYRCGVECYISDDLCGLCQLSIDYIKQT